MKLEAAAAHAGSLVALEQRLAYEMACLQLPAPRWTPALEHAGQPVADVAIIGAGMAGLALAAALQHRGVSVVVYDQSPAGWEGPWATTARMETLRSPKQLAGPALGLASLSFRAWFEVQWGAVAWEAMDKIPRLQWMDYLRWYRQVLGIEVHNDHAVLDVWPQGHGAPEGLIALRVQRARPAGQPSEVFTAYARRLVLATGRAGLGGNAVPDWVHGLPRSHWAHSADELDYNRLRGLRVGVVGAGASAMDSAATALDCGAAAVRLLVRRPDLPRINKGKGAGSPGFTHGFGRVPDAWKWRIRHYINAQQVPPPRGSTLRVSGHANAAFHLGCAVQGATVQGQTLRVQTSQGAIELDFLIFGTGFSQDWSQRPMLRHIEPHVRLWQDRWPVEAGQEDEELSASPDLGPDFEFQPREGQSCAGLERIHCFCYPAALSLGVITGDIPAISEGAIGLATRLCGLLYAQDVDYHFEHMRQHSEPELLGDEWVPTPFPALPERPVKPD